MIRVFQRRILTVSLPSINRSLGARYLEESAGDLSFCLFVTFTVYFACLLVTNLILHFASIDHWHIAASFIILTLPGHFPS